MKIIKKDGSLTEFNPVKILNAIQKSADRVMYELTDEDKEFVVNFVKRFMKEDEMVSVNDIHKLVEMALDERIPNVGKSYRDYRNYKTDFIYMMDEVYKKSQEISSYGDRDNANADSALMSTQRALKLAAFNKEEYKKFFLTTEENSAVKEGYIYIHDMGSSRSETFNCCLFDIATVLKNGFEMSGRKYKEPNSLPAAFAVVGDIILAVASQQYGGFSLPEMDKVLAPYAEKSYRRYLQEEITHRNHYLQSDDPTEDDYVVSVALKRLERDFIQGFQGLEYKLNTVSSSRGDFVFVSVSYGLGTTKLEKMASFTMMQVRKTGQGDDGKKTPMLFPKLIFLYDEELHGAGGVNEDLFDAAIECSKECMYPDFLSLTGEGYVPSMYKKYKETITPMGCRAFLSPWYERGGMNPADDQDRPVFLGRFNMGAITLNLCMIYAKAKEEGKDFFEVLDYYLEMVRKIHLRTIKALGNRPASIDPICFCEGGFYGGHLKPNQKIKPLLKSATISFGYSGLNELEQLHHQKSLVEDGSFALKTMEFINDRVNKFKKEDKVLYAIYGTPGESLLPLQVKQFRKKYGTIKNVSDHEYMSNSFHCCVREEITPIEKQDLENRFWNLSNGGKIQYVKYPINYNTEAVKTLVRRAMKMGFYEGVNLDLSYCEDCGYSQLDMEVCPKCNSKNIIAINRVCGYLGYSKIHGDTRMNAGKLQELKERKSM